MDIFHHSKDNANPDESSFMSKKMDIKMDDLSFIAKMKEAVRNNQETMTLVKEDGTIVEIKIKNTQQPNDLSI